MTILTDPDVHETAALFDLVDLDFAEVLEIGCGDGRLTRRYADRTSGVTAIDPFEDAIARATPRLEAEALPIDFRRVAFEDFAADAANDVVDVAIPSWSLC
jgi:2-polyprenyl-3-methyl-5-hydroxy-6-metoxy-1,4-benzoquinol methylase